MVINLVDYIVTRLFEKGPKVLFVFKVLCPILAVWMEERSNHFGLRHPVECLLGNTDSIQRNELMLDKR